MEEALGKLVEVSGLPSMSGNRTAIAQPGNPSRPSFSVSSGFAKESSGEFAQALENVSTPSQRAKRMKGRILHCLEPLTNAVPRAPLHKQISDPGSVAFRIRANSPQHDPTQSPGLTL